MTPAAAISSIALYTMARRYEMAVTGHAVWGDEPATLPDGLTAEGVQQYRQDRDAWQTGYLAALGWTYSPLLGWQRP